MLPLNIPRNIVGGITAAIASLPLSLAFGVSSGLGAQAGLYGAIFLGFFSAIFGGTKGLISAPTAPMTTVSAIIIGNLIGHLGSLENAYGSIVLLFIIAGITQILFGVFKFGKFVHFIPYPVVSGFMTGIGLLVILSQVGAVLGIAPSIGKVDLIGLIWHRKNILSWEQITAHINITAFYVSMITFILVVIFSKLTKKIPASLTALLVMTTACVMMNVNIPTIGQIPSSFPHLQLPDFNISVFSLVLIGGIQLGGLGVLDTLLTSVIADKLTKTRHEPNKEVIGQGIGQIISALFGGILGAGTTTCTVINIKSGGNNWISGIANALFLLAILMFFTDLTAHIPMAVLAGILLKVGLDIIDYQGLKYIKVVPKTDSFITILVLLVTVIDDLLDAVGIGMLVALVMFMKKMSDVMTMQSYLEPLAKYLQKHHLENYINRFDEDILKHSFVKVINGPLFFGHTPIFQERLSKINHAKILVLEMSKVPYIDEAGIYAFKESLEDLKNNGVHAFLVGAQPAIIQMFKASGICATFPATDAVIDIEHDIYEDMESWLDTLSLNYHAVKGS